MTELLIGPSESGIDAGADEAGNDAGAPVLKVLIADDAATERMILARIVRKAGFEVVMAVDGQDALDKFASEKPDILLLDVMMPHYDGKQVAQRVRAALGQEIVPIIFVTSLSDPADLAECIAAGGDDFISKPYNQIVISAKLGAHRRLRVMHGVMREQSKEIERNNAHLIQEQEVAKAVFDRVIHTGGLTSPNIRYMLSPLAVFNGDVLLASYQPSGNLHVLLADFTGHGLPAAIGAIPLAETFYSMTRKGFEIEDIIEEANNKLRQVLPVGVFSCCAAVSMDFRKQRVRIWLGGLPECVLSRQSGEYEMLHSSHLPLGILGPDQFRSTCLVREMEVGDRLLLWSDGIVEAENAEGEQFGNDRLEAIVAGVSDPNAIYDAILEGVSAHIGDSERNDDITLLECRMAAREEIRQASEVQPQSPAGGISDVELLLSYGAESLRASNPIPQLITNIMQVSGLRHFAGELQTILAEMFSNALEHGVLGLKSALKQAPNGFTEYYTQRAERLLTLQDGFVRFSLRHDPDEIGGRLTIRVSDSGAGFDHTRLKSSIGDESKFSGRGVSLLNELCESVRHLDHGTTTEVVFRWEWPESLRPSNTSE